LPRPLLSRHVQLGTFFRSLSAATSNPGTVLPQGVTIEGAFVDRRTLRVAYVALFGGLSTVLTALLAMRVCIDL
jgi:hypothetical protein